MSTAIPNSIEWSQVFLAEQLLLEGSEQSPRGQKTLEILNHHSIIEDPRQRVCRLRARRLNPSYLAAEFLWYLSGDVSAKKIGRHASLWNDIADDRGKVVSNYGRWIYHGGEDSVFWRAIRALEADPSSRQAIIPIYTAQRATMNPRDVPCTLFLQLFIRDGRLHCITTMRSNDAVFGYTNDVFQFTMVQELALACLKSKYPDLELGTYFHNAGSMHVYERHFEMMGKIADVSKYDMDHRPFSVADESLPHTMEPFPAFRSLKHFDLWRDWMVQQFWAERIRGDKISDADVETDVADYWRTTIKETLKYERK